MAWFYFLGVLLLQGILGETDASVLFRKLLQYDTFETHRGPSGNARESSREPRAYSSAYPIPDRPVEKWSPDSVSTEPMCPGPAVGCFEGHIRHCLSKTMRQDQAKIIRSCDRGCKSCGEGQPAVCLDDRHGANVCESIMQSHRKERTCEPSQNGVVGCFNGPDVGYCFQSRVYMVDFCGEAGCTGKSDQCNVAPPLPSTPPDVMIEVPETSSSTSSSDLSVSSASTVTISTSTTRPLGGADNDLCTSNALICHNGHLRLCLTNMPKDRARVLHDCRKQGCSRCGKGPDLCNDEKGANMCEQVSQDLYVADCRNQMQDTSYCDNDNVRVCEPGGRGVLAEYCGSRSCQKSPAQCFRPLPAAELCQGTYVHCYQGHIRQCQGKEPLAQSEIIHNCRTQGCSACPNGPPMCNNEQRQSQCGRVSSERLVISCSASQQGTTYCADGDDVRHCNSSSLAAIVEYCDARGCQANQCNAAAGSVSPIVSGKGKGGTGKGGANSTATGNCGSRVRSEWGATPDAVRAQYIKAVNQLYANGEMVKLAQLHYDNRDQIHGSGVIHFFLWHRVFLNDFEERLRALPGYECLTVPYWNYDYSNINNHADRRSVFGTQSTKLGQGETADCIGGAFASFTHSLEGTQTCIRRNPNRETEATLSNSIFVDLAQIGQDDFMQYASNLQNAHGYPHVTYGDTFATHYSPIDPLFFVHHANIDRLWDMWQDCHNDYSWYEAGGLSTPVVAYNGVTAADFIDNSQYRWKGNSYSLKYSSDQFNDPSVYSSDFRRSVLTRCRDGKFRRYDTPSPILSIDDSWSRPTDRSFEFPPEGGPQTQPEVIQVKQEDVPLPCSQPSGTSDFVALRTNTVPIAVYDNMGIQDCVARCDTFYWKKSGESNCVCMKSAERNSQTVSLSSASIKRFTPTCGGNDGDYALYQIAPSSQGRRLQAVRSQRLDSENEENAKNNTNDDNATSSESLEDDLDSESNNTSTDAGSSEEASSNASSVQAVPSVNSNDLNDTSLRIVPLDNEFNDTSSDLDSEEPSNDSSARSINRNETSTFNDTNIVLLASALNDTFADFGSSEELSTDSNVGLNDTARTTSLIVPLDNDTFTGSSEEASTFDSNASSAQNTSARTDLLVIPLDNEFNASADFGSSEESTTDFGQNASDDGRNRNATLEDTFRNVQIVLLNATQDSQESSNEGRAQSEEDIWNSSSEEDANGDSPKAQPLCFQVPATPKNRTEIACSSKASTPIPLPRAWLLMNNLNPDAPDACQTWTPAVGSKIVDCVHV